MSIPKAKALVEAESKALTSSGADVAAGEALARSHNVDASVESGEVLNAVSCFNDYVAIMLTPKKTMIAMPTGSENSSVGVIVGIGPKCENEFILGECVVINPKGGAIVMVEEQGPEYEGKVVKLFQERNVFYTAKNGPKVTVNK